MTSDGLVIHLSREEVEAMSSQVKRRSIPLSDYDWTLLELAAHKTRRRVRDLLREAVSEKVVEILGTRTSPSSPQHTSQDDAPRTSSEKQSSRNLQRSLADERTSTPPRADEMIGA